jgi:23S rRNA (uracil1939-C5)-methyltransferase
VRGGLPGESVTAEVSGQRGGVRFADVVQLRGRSRERVDPDCGAHPECGGCDLLDFSAAAQADAKEEMIQDALRRTAKLSSAELMHVAPLARAELGAGARRRARWHVDEEGGVGFYSRSSRDLVPLGACPAVDPLLDTLLTDLAEADWCVGPCDIAAACDDDGRVCIALSNARSKRDAERLARRAVESGTCTGALVLNRRGRVTSRWGDTVLQGELAQRAPGGPYRSDAATFTQATRFGALQIQDAVLKTARELRDKRVLELFAGAGHLTLPLAAAGAEVHAVEGDSQAYQWLERNVAASPVASRISTEHAFLGERWLDGGPGRHEVDALVVDPPRAGFPALGGFLDALEPRLVALVSCDLATGARDLRQALDKGYTLERLRPIDAFPRTAHVEWVAQLRRS